MQTQFNINLALTIVSGLGLWFTQPHIEWVTGPLSPFVNRMGYGADHSLRLVLWSGKSFAISLPPTS
jgi:hypothetical protein